VSGKKKSVFQYKTPHGQTTSRRNMIYAATADRSAPGDTKKRITCQRKESDESGCTHAIYLLSGSEFSGELQGLNCIWNLPV